MDHVLTVTYTNSDDGVWLKCTCQWEKNMDFAPTMTDLVEATDEHLMGRRCGLAKTRGPNTSGEMVCPVHCSKCGHDRKFEDYLDFCSECKQTEPCSPINATRRD